MVETEAITNLTNIKNGQREERDKARVRPQTSNLMSHDMNEFLDCQISKPLIETSKTRTKTTYDVN